MRRSFSCSLASCWPVTRPSTSRLPTTSRPGSGMPPSTGCGCRPWPLFLFAFFIWVATPAESLVKVERGMAAGSAARSRAASLSGCTRVSSSTLKIGETAESGYPLPGSLERAAVVLLLTIQVGLALSAASRKARRFLMKSAI